LSTAASCSSEIVNLWIRLLMSFSVSAVRSVALAGTTLVTAPFQGTHGSRAKTCGVIRRRPRQDGVAVCDCVLGDVDGGDGLAHDFNVRCKIGLSSGQPLPP